MKKYALLPALTLLGGAAAFALRLMQARTGFEAATGLAVPGNLWGRLLVVLLAALAVLFLLLCRKLPDEKESPAAFSGAFSVRSPALLALPVAGVFLLGLSGALEAVFGVLGASPALPGGMTAVVWMGSPSPRIVLLQGLLSLAAAACLFPSVAACRRREDAPQRPPRGGLLLVPVVCMVVRLVLVYRADSINPSLAAYYVELLALVFLTLALYRLSSFGCGAGRTRRFALYAMAAAALCVASMADGPGLTGFLFCAGGALTVLGFLLLRLEVLAAPWDNT